MSDDRRDEPDPLDDALDSWLLAYEEWRATTGASGAKLAPDALPAPLRSRMLEVARCIEVLDRTLGSDRSSHAGSHDHQSREITGSSSSPQAIFESHRLLNLATPADSSANARLGKFEIIRELGRGGFSIVYLAVDTVMNRQVALKVPLPALLLTPDLRMRWLREAQAAASLAHPNIVRAYEAGEIGPVCYIASAYYSGPALSAWLRERSVPVPPATAARIVLALAAAAEHAHQRGILHRDIKPSNVLLEPLSSDSKGPESIDGPESVPLEFVPKLADFGLAKLLEPTGNADATRTGLVVGTPAYMAPEQAAGRLDEIGPATDVYALGAILYELLTGRTPVELGSNGQVARSAELLAPIPPRTIRSAVPRDLESITLKCLALEPSDRYPTAHALGDDLERFLNQRPTEARPTSAWARGRNLVRHRPAMTSLLVTLGVLVIAAMSATVWFFRLSRTTAQASQRAEEMAVDRDLAADRLAFIQHRQRYASQISRAQQAWEKGETGRVMSLLDGLRPARGEKDSRGFEWHFLWSLVHREMMTLPFQLSCVDAMAVDAAGSRVAVPVGEGKFMLWNLPANQSEMILNEPGLTGTHSLAFSPDGKLLAAACATVANDGQPVGTAIVWDLASGKPLVKLRRGNLLHYVTFSPNGKLLSYGGETTVTLWDVVERREVASLKQDGTVRSVTFAPDGETLAVGADSNGDGTVSLWNIPTGSKQRTLRHSSGYGGCSVAFSPLGDLLASGSEDCTIKLWDAKTGEDRMTLRGHKRPVWSLAFDPAGLLLASGDRGASGPESGELKIWDTRTGAERSTFSGHPRGMTAVTFLNPTTVVSASDDGTVKLWDLTWRDPTFDLTGHSSEVWSVAFAPNGRVLATASDDHTVKLWDLATRKNLRTLSGHDAMVSSVAFSAVSQTLATGSYDGTVKLWDLETGQVQFTMSGHTAAVRCVAFAPDGKTLASGGKDNTIRLWDTNGGRLVATLSRHTDHVRGVVFTTDGKTLWSASLDRTVRFWDIATGQSRVAAQHAETVQCLACSPNGATLATGDSAGIVRLWDRQTETQRSVLFGGSSSVTSLSFSPDGKTLAVASRDGAIRLWDPITGQEMLSLQHSSQSNAVAFAPDGETLAAGFHDGVVRVWDVNRVARTAAASQ